MHETDHDLLIKIAQKVDGMEKSLDTHIVNEKIIMTKLPALESNVKWLMKIVIGSAGFLTTLGAAALAAYWSK